MQGYFRDPESEKTVINEDFPLLKSFLIGSFSGTFSTILFQPLDLVKTRLQNKVNNCGIRHGMTGTFVNIVQQENVFGLWRGITPSIIRVVPGVGLYFSSLHWLKHSLQWEEPLSPIRALVLGATARAMSGALLIPITVVKTRYESGVYKYSSTREALQLIYRNEGVRGLSSGLVPTLLRDAPFSGIYLLFYTQFKKVVCTESPDQQVPPYKHFSCGLLAGIFASIVTQPADVVKTKMQLYPNEFTNTYDAIFKVYRKYGFCGYLKGIVPRMLRRTLMTTMAWTLYEQITRKIGIA